MDFTERNTTLQLNWKVSVVPSSQVWQAWMIYSQNAGAGVLELLQSAAATCNEHIEKQSRDFEESSSISAALKPLQGQEEVSSLVASVLALAAPCTHSSHSHC